MQQFQQTFQQMVRKWLPSENSTLLLLAVGVGVATSIGVWLFQEGITLFQQSFQQGLMGSVFAILGRWGIIPVLGLAGLIVGYLSERFIGEERHHGVAGIMESSAFTGGRLRYSRMPIKALLASFSLGAGASVGQKTPVYKSARTLAQCSGSGCGCLMNGFDCS